MLGARLFLHDLQHFHGACLDADAAGDALGGNGGFRYLDDHAEGADLLALAAAGAELLVDHVHALGILGDGIGLADLGTFSALYAGHGLGFAILLHDADAGLILMEFLIKRFGTGPDALETRHAFHAFFHCQSFHMPLLYVLNWIPSAGRRPDLLYYI